MHPVLLKTDTKGWWMTHWGVGVYTGDLGVICITSEVTCLDTARSWHPGFPSPGSYPASRTALPFLTDKQTKSLEKDGSLFLWVNIMPQFWSTNSTLGIQLTEICRASQCWVLSDAEDTVKTELQDCITHSRQMSKDCSSWKFQGHIHYWVTLTKHVYESISCPFRHMNYAQIFGT